MRLWSLHPGYLDRQGLVAAWREALLAQAVLAGKTRGYTSHPQLARFRSAPTPDLHIAAYLEGIHAEACRRGYRFDEAKLTCTGTVSPLVITDGQLGYEWRHLKTKLEQRAPAWLRQFPDVTTPRPHPLFRVSPGGVAEWETGASAGPTSAP